MKQFELSCEIGKKSAMTKAKDKASASTFEYQNNSCFTDEDRQQLKKIKKCILLCLKHQLKRHK